MKFINYESELENRSGPFNFVRSIQGSVRVFSVLFSVERLQLKYSRFAFSRISFKERYD